MSLFALFSQDALDNNKVKLQNLTNLLVTPTFC